MGDSAIAGCAIFSEHAHRLYPEGGWMIGPNVAKFLSIPNVETRYSRLNF